MFRKSFNKILDKFKPNFTRNIKLNIENENEAKLLNFSIVKSAIVTNDLNVLMGIYQKILNCDLNISAKLETRKDALLSLDFEIQADLKEKIIIDKILESLDMEDLLKSIANDMYFGISMINIVYEVKDNLILPIQHKAIMPTLLHEENLEGKLKLYFYNNKNGDEKKLYIDTIDKNRLLIHTHKIDNCKLQNSSIAYKLLWSAILKHTIITLNLEYFDKAAVPPLIIKVDDLSDTKKADELFKAMMELKSTSIGLFTQDTEIETLKFGNKVDFEKSISYIDKKINEFIVGGNLSSSSEGSGSQALGRVHDDRLMEKIKADSKLINKTISSFLNNVLALNLDTYKPVKFKYILPLQKNHDELETKSKIVQNLVSSGYAVPVKYVSETFNIEDITFKKVEAGANNHIELNKQILKENNDLETKALEDEIMGYVADIVEESNSDDDLLDKLLEQYNFMDFQKFEEILTKENIKASIAGSISVGNDK